MFVEDLSDIAQWYFKSCGEHVSIFHSNHHLARSLLNYAEAHSSATDAECVSVLRQLLAHLPKMGQLAKKVIETLNKRYNLEVQPRNPIDFTESQFGDYLLSGGAMNTPSEIVKQYEYKFPTETLQERDTKLFFSDLSELVEANNKNSLTVDVVKRLGQWYLDEYGKKENCFHSNQKVANQLIAYANTNREASADDCASLLVAMLKKIPNHGQLVEQTVSLLNKAYGLSISTEESMQHMAQLYAGPILPMMKSPYQVAREFQSAEIGSNLDDYDCYFNDPPKTRHQTPILFNNELSIPASYEFDNR
ncbi:hypothetical protein L3V82_02100 [Thiotrichales bacterium 19S3-7]|nr:hypothetical protein [Thiotrichales bacterium 19S3-7]MCF6800958.1 hypothetical protein [Thiotrichales bacterium 19S3-11]